MKNSRTKEKQMKPFNAEQMKESLTRQLDLLPIDSLNKSITIIGAGAIGGWTTLSLAKMGFTNITVMDFDTVDIVNLNSQLYRFKDIGKSKVEALKDIVKDFTNVDIEVVNDKYTGATIMTDIIISAVDSMEVRKTIWDANKGMSAMVIDPRMGSETALLYVMGLNDSKDIESYEKTLYSNENAVSEPCTRKSTQYCALALSGLVCCQVKSIVTNNPYTRITQWNLPSGSFMSWGKQNA